MCREEQDKEMLNQAFRNQLWLWLRARVVPVYNYHATGNEVVQIISDNTPAGMTNHIIGMQNIKGTGLDFAYRWVAWNNCYQFCQAIQSDDSIRVREGIEALATFGDHGPLTFWLTQQTIEVAKHSVATQNEYYQSQIQQIEKNLEKSIEKSKKIDLIDEGSGESTSSLFDKLLETIESFLDAGDAVKRRKRANLIYKDLVNHHISHKRAAIELQAITKRQKGGWFVQRVKSLPWFRKSEL
jgi:hypothetical protein